MLEPSIVDTRRVRKWMMACFSRVKANLPTVAGSGIVGGLHDDHTSLLQAQDFLPISPVFCELPWVSNNYVASRMSGGTRRSGGSWIDMQIFDYPTQRKLMSQ